MLTRLNLFEAVRVHCARIKHIASTGNSFVQCGGDPSINLSLISSTISRGPVRYMTRNSCDWKRIVTSGWSPHYSIGVTAGSIAALHT